jgi:hypothetical protein
MKYLFLLTFLFTLGSSVTWSQEILRVQGRQALVEFNRGIHYVEVGDSLELSNRKNVVLKVEQKGESFLLTSVTRGEASVGDRVRFRSAPDQLTHGGHSTLQRHSLSVGYSSTKQAGLNDNDLLLFDPMSFSGAVFMYTFRRTPQWMLGITLSFGNSTVAFDPSSNVNPLDLADELNPSADLFFDTSTLFLMDVQLRRFFSQSLYIGGLLGMYQLKVSGEINQANVIDDTSLNFKGIGWGVTTGWRKEFQRLFIDLGLAYRVVQFSSIDYLIDGEETDTRLEGISGQALSIQGLLGFKF